MANELLLLLLLLLAACMGRNVEKTSSKRQLDDVRADSRKE